MIWSNGMSSCHDRNPESNPSSQCRYRIKISRILLTLEMLELLNLRIKCEMSVNKVNREMTVAPEKCELSVSQVCINRAKSVNRL